MCAFDLVLNTYTFIITIILILLTTIYQKSIYSFWNSRGVIGPTPIPFCGNVFEFFFESIADISVERTKKYGKLYGVYEGPTPTLVVGDANIIKHICVKDFSSFANRRVFEKGDDLFVNMLTVAEVKKWKRLRKIISPTFSTGKIKRMKYLIDRCIKNANNHLELVSSGNNPLNLKQFWSRFTVDVIACCCFATEINSHENPNSEFFEHVSRFFRSPGFIRRVKVMSFFLLPKEISKFLKIDIFESSSLQYMSGIIRHILKQRRDQGGTYNDFLQLLFEAEMESDKSEEPLTEIEIISNCILFFIAGYDTTATLLQFCCYSLAVNQEIQEKLYEEIKEYFNESDDIDYETANKLPYLDAVISETLRMYPPSVLTERSSTIETTVADTGVKIPKNTLIQIPIYAIHHDQEYFSEPEVFNPDRFLGDNREKIVPYSYLPFGAGPRNCVAMRFALIEAKLAIIQTLLKFKIVKSSKTETPKFAKYTTFLISSDIFVDVVKR